MCIYTETTRCHEVSRSIHGTADTCRSSLTEMFQWLLVTYGNQVNKSYMELSGLGGTGAHENALTPFKKATTVLPVDHGP